MKNFEKVLEKRCRKIAMIDDMQFGFIPGKSTIDAVFSCKDTRRILS